MKAKKILSNYFIELNTLLNKKLPSKNLYKPIFYTFNLGGKSIRPFFLLYSYKIFGGKGKQINQVALALESLHNALASNPKDGLIVMGNDNDTNFTNLEHITSVGAITL